MAISLDSSLVLAAIVGLWLVRVAPCVLRSNQPEPTGGNQPEPMASTPPVSIGSTRSREGNTMTTTTSGDTADRPESTGTELLSSAAQRQESDPAALSSSIAGLRWDRIVLALGGLAALLIALVTIVLALFGLVSFVVPVVCLAVSVAAVAVLRFLAVRSRRARVDRAFAAAMAPGPSAGPAPVQAPVQAPSTRAPSRRPTALFDAEQAAPRPLTAMELRTAALAVAHGSSAVRMPVETGSPAGDDAAGPVTPEHAAAASSTTTDSSGPVGATAWVPVAVPRPTYVDAARADRAAPLPLDLPEAPRASSGTPIKAAEAAARRSTGTAPDEIGAGGTGVARIEVARIGVTGTGATGTGSAAVGSGGTGSAESDPTGNESTGNESTGNEPAEDDPAGNEPAGNESAAAEPCGYEAGKPAADRSAQEPASTGHDTGSGTTGGPAHGRIDLDDVLQRRRA